MNYPSGDEVRIGDVVAHSCSYQTVTSADRSAGNRYIHLYRYGKVLVDHCTLIRRADEVETPESLEGRRNREAREPKTMPHAPQIDPVKHPPHYTTGKIEAWDAIRAMLGDEGFIAYCRGTVVKYLWRAPHKGHELEDYQKAKAYLEKLTGVKSEAK